MKSTLIILFFLVHSYAYSSALSSYSTQDFLLAVEQAGCQAKGAKAEPNGRYLYVAEMCGHIQDNGKVAYTTDANGKRSRIASVSIFDLLSHKRVKVVATPAASSKGILGNTEVEFSLDGKWALVTRAEGSEPNGVYPRVGMVTVINTATQEIAKYIPLNGNGSKIIAIRPILPGDDRQIVYVANYFTDNISVLDITDLKDDKNYDGRQHLVDRIRLSSKHIRPESRGYKLAPRGIAFTPDGKYALVLNSENGSVAIVDSVEHKQVAELEPINPSLFGRDVNVRHIVTTKDGNYAYLSHMRGNAVSKMNLKKLRDFVDTELRRSSKKGVISLGSQDWLKILEPIGSKRLLVLEDYPHDHPNFANKTWNLAHPNTIVLDPINNRYLYVSHRTTSNEDYRIIDKSIKGKIDIIDLQTGEVIFSLVGGAQPTALEVSPDNRTLVSGGFKDDKMYFYDIGKLLDLYESGQRQSK